MKKYYLIRLRNTTQFQIEFQITDVRTNRSGLADSGWRFRRLEYRSTAELPINSRITDQRRKRGATAGRSPVTSEQGVEQIVDQLANSDIVRTSGSVGGDGSG